MSDNSTEKNDKFSCILSVIDFIESHYAENHSIKFYADICRLDKYYFIRLFREYTGFSPHLYKTKIRMEKAKELLKNTELNNSKIAELTGYSTSYYFSRIFKSHVGVSPEAFRNKNKKK